MVRESESRMLTGLLIVVKSAVSMIFVICFFPKTVRYNADASENFNITLCKQYSWVIPLVYVL